MTLWGYTWTSADTDEIVEGYVEAENAEQARGLVEHPTLDGKLTIHMASPAERHDYQGA